MTIEQTFQWILALGFLIACVRLIIAAKNGASTVRPFRILGAVVTGGWTAFYVSAAIDPGPSFHLADVARGLQYFNLVLFLVWGTIRPNTAWLRESQGRLEKLKQSEISIELDVMKANER